MFLQPQRKQQAPNNGPCLVVDPFFGEDVINHEGRGMLKTAGRLDMGTLDLPPVLAKRGGASAFRTSQDLSRWFFRAPSQEARGPRCTATLIPIQSKRSGNHRGTGIAPEVAYRITVKEKSCRPDP